MNAATRPRPALVTARREERHPDGSRLVLAYAEGRGGVHTVRVAWPGREPEARRFEQIEAARRAWAAVRDEATALGYRRAD